MNSARRVLDIAIVVAALVAGAGVQAGEIRFTFGLTRSIDACEDLGDRIRYRSGGQWYDIRKADVQEITEVTCTDRASGAAGPSSPRSGDLQKYYPLEEDSTRWYTVKDVTTGTTVDFMSFTVVGRTTLNNGTSLYLIEHRSAESINIEYQQISAEGVDLHRIVMA